MISRQQWAIIKKDVKSVVVNKQLFVPMLILPLLFTVVVPSIFILIAIFAPIQSSDLQQLIQLIPRVTQGENLRESIIRLMLNNMIPLFFLFIPIMVASIMAAGSFVGEKEKRTLETLLYSPLSITKIFQAKVLASFLLSMFISFISFVFLIFVVEGLLFFFLGKGILPGIAWALILFVVAPALSLISIALIVRGSIKAKTIEESQQKAVFLVLPIILLLVGQFVGLFLINAGLLLLLGIVLMVLATFLMKEAAKGFQYEKILQ